MGSGSESGPTRETQPDLPDLHAALRLEPRDEPLVFRCWEYHQAVLAAHQLRLRGCAAEVFGYAYGTAPWPLFGFHVVVFPPIAGDGEGEEVGDLEQGAFCRGLDAVVRFAVVYVVALALASGGVVALKWAQAHQHGRDPEPAEALVSFVFLAGSLPFGLVGYGLYRGFRRGSWPCRVVFLGAGWFVLLHYDPLALVAFGVVLAGVAAWRLVASVVDGCRG